MFEKRTKWKIVRVTAFWVFVGYLYIHRDDIFEDLRHMMRESKWEQEEPRGTLIDGKKNGEWITYFTNERPAKVENYRNDTLHGPQIRYTPDGVLQFRGKYNMGMLVDSAFSYYGNGKLNYMHCYDSAGTFHGPFSIYEPNGQLTQSGQYTNGKYDGEFRRYFTTGEIREIQHYDMGQRVGLWIKFSPAGDTLEVEHY